MSRLKTWPLYIAAGVISFGVILFCIGFVYVVSIPTPEIKLSAQYEKPLHRPVQSISDIKTDNHKKIIRPGSYFYTHREYEMIGSFDNCHHFSFIRNKKTSWVGTTESKDVIAIDGSVRMSFFYKVQNPTMLGEYSLTTRIVCNIAPMRPQWKYDFPPLYFEVK